MTIRKATPGDAYIIAECNISLARETEDLLLNPAVVIAGVAAVLQDAAKGVYYVAETPEGEVAGQLMITYEWSDWRNGNIWWIQSVYVREEFRARGVFHELFLHVRQLAREAKDVCALRLYMEKENETARRAYLKHGLRETAYAVFELEVERA